MSQMKRRTSTISVVLTLIICLVAGTIYLQSSSNRIHAVGAAAQYASYNALVGYMNKHHKAPFLSKLALTQHQWQAFAQKQQPRAASAGTNIRVNQDRNPWPKLEIASSVNPLNGQDDVIITNDYRQGYIHMFYHVSTDGGQTWSDDSLPQSVDQATSAPYSYQVDPGVVFDRAGHTFISNLAGNLITDSFTGYINYDNEIDVTVGFANGTYTSLNTTTADYVPCNGNAYADTIDCPGQLDKPFISIDTVPGSPHEGSIYVYYTYFCNGVPTSSGTLAPCTDGHATIPVFGSAILETHASGIGMPFSPPTLVSGHHSNVQFSDLVVDKHGGAHLFFEDYTDFPILHLYESSYIANGGWKVHKDPIVTFQYNGLKNSNWQFSDIATTAPTCTIHEDKAYCTFSASQIGEGPLSSTPSIYLAVTDTLTSVTQVHRVNNDAIDGTNDHFFPWPSVTPNGTLYVGWYDNRNDPFMSRVQYFVGKSTDGGKTFPTQLPISDAQFNPCNAFPSCVSFGNYTQLVTGPDGVTHATWSDTRDSASAQLYTQTITW